MSETRVEELRNVGTAGEVAKKPARITVKIPGMKKEVISDVGQFIILTIPSNMNPEDTQLMTHANPQSMAEMAAYLMKCAKHLLKGEDPRDNYLGKFARATEEDSKSRIVLPKGQR